MHATHSQWCEARVRTVHTRTRLALVRTILAASAVETTVVSRFCRDSIVLRTLVSSWCLWRLVLKYWILRFVFLHKVHK